MSVRRATNVALLEKEKPYSIVWAERVQTKYRIPVLLTIRVSSGEDVIRVFLPKCFSPVFSDTDLDKINGGMLKINLIYHGTIEKSNAC